MKQIITFIISIFIIAEFSYSQNTFCDDFENYQFGDPIGETSSSWETWSSIATPIPPYADDATVTNTLSSSGNNSLYFVGVGAGGPQDIVLLFGSATPYTIGDFEFSANFFVNNGTGAYFNFQAENLPGIKGNICSQDSPRKQVSKRMTQRYHSSEPRVPFYLGLYSVTFIVLLPLKHPSFGSCICH